MPAGHCIATEHWEALVEELDAVAIPRGHAVHAELPLVLEYVAAGQAVQLEEPAAPLNVPMAHAVQEAELFESKNPAGHI